MTMTQPPETTPVSTEPPPDAGGFNERPHPHFARLAVIVATLLAVSAVTLLCHRWLTRPEPTAFFQVRGSESFDGAAVVVTGGLTEEPVRLLLNRDNRFTAHFPLAPGTYEFTVTHSGKVVAARPFILREANGMLFTLQEQPAPARTPAP